MVIRIPSNNRAFTIVVGVLSRHPVLIGISAKDTSNPANFFVKRKGKVDLRTSKGYFREFQLKFPQSPHELIVNIRNLNSARKYQGNNDPTFKVVKFTKKDLVTRPIWMSPETLSFVKLAKEFSERASTLTSGDRIPHIYRSDDGKFNIDYYDKIRDRKYGHYVNTPARIGHSTGKIEVSKRDFVKYTVPMRMIILLHEYSHKYMNPKIGRQISYETGADINALLLYLSLGYSEMEACQAFLYVFRGADTELNHKRYKIIKDFISKFHRGLIAPAASQAA